MPEANNTVRWLAIDQLRPGPYQTRKRFKPDALKELAQSIKTSGIVQPIIVRYRIKTGEYEIIAGESRSQVRQVPIPDNQKRKLPVRTFCPQFPFLQPMQSPRRIPVWQ
jgi:hypothetical protein